VSEGVILPKGAFAVAKMLDGVISQQESYGLEEVRVLTLPHPRTHPRLKLHSSSQPFSLTLRPRPRPSPFTLPQASLRTAQVFDGIVEDFLRSGATVREFASVGWRSLLYQARGAPPAGPPKKEESTSSVT